MGVSEFNISELAEILAKSFREDLSEDEARLLHDWLEASEDNRVLYARMKQEAWFEEKMKEASSVDWKQDYSAFMKAHRPAFAARRRLRMSFGYAAGFLLFVAVGVGVLLRSFPDEPGTSPQVEMVVQQIGNEAGGKAVLTLVDGEQIVLNDTGRLASKEQTGALLDITGTALSYRPTAQSGAEQAYNQLTVSRGGEYYLILSDGTKIWLNSESHLRYPVTFTGTDRKVYLTGEAFFTVAPDAKKPFIVVAGGTETEVLGTEFNVRAYPEEVSVATTLVKGSVRMRADEGTSNVVLSPGEQGSFWKEKKTIEKQVVDTYFYTAWKDGRLVFRRTKMEELLKVLSRWYDVEVVYKDKEVRNFSFTGDLSKTDRIEALLNIIESNGLVAFSLEGKTLVVSKK